MLLRSGKDLPRELARGLFDSLRLEEGRRHKNGQ
jgi:hypothetical protein